MKVSSLRFDAAPLLAIVRSRTLDREGVEPTTRSISLMLGVSADTVMRWKRHGFLRLVSAESAADALGLCPSELWPDYWDRLNALYDEELARV